MSSSYSSGSTQVNGSVTTVGTFTPQSVEVSSAHGVKQGSNGSTTVLTVPAGHQYRVVGWDWNCSVSASTTQGGSCAIGSTVLSAHGYAATAGNLAMASDSNMLPVGYFIKLTAGATCTVTVDAGNYSCSELTVYYIDVTL